MVLFSTQYVTNRLMKPIKPFVFLRTMLRPGSTQNEGDSHFTSTNKTFVSADASLDIFATVYSTEKS